MVKWLVGQFNRMIVGGSKPPAPFDLNKEYVDEEYVGEDRNNQNDNVIAVAEVGSAGMMKMHGSGPGSDAEGFKGGFGLKTRKLLEDDVNDYPPTGPNPQHDTPPLPPPIA